MATYSTLNPGATGDDVLKLKDYLKKNGYTVKYADANYGNSTLGLVKQFQKAQGLSDTGIVDAGTWGKLTAVDTPVMSTTPRGNQYDPKTSTATKADLSALEGTAPGAYVSPYQEQIANMLAEIQGRGNFSYDAAADPMYQQMQERYQQQGKLAMQDTMGNAAALTGGYGNSYATTAGQQAYNNYLQGANDALPDFYANAQNQFNQQNTDRYNQLSAIQGMENTNYGRYRDETSDYYTDLAYMQQKYADELAQSNYEREFAQQYPSTSGGGGGSSGGRSSGKKSSGSSGSTSLPASTAGASATVGGQLSESAALQALRTIRATEGDTAAARAIQEMYDDAVITKETAKALRKSGTAYGKKGVTM